MSDLFAEYRDKVEEIKKPKSKGVSYAVLILLLIATAVNIGFIVQKKHDYDAFLRRVRYEPPDRFTFTFLDVGQGDCAIIQTPEGYVLMYDGGSGGKKYADHQFGRSVDATPEILDFFYDNGIKKIDLLIVSHAHSDHYGALLGMLNESDIEVGLYMDPGLPVASYGYEALLTLIKERDILYKVPLVGEVLQNTKDLEIQVLDVDPKTTGSANHSSVVLLVRYNDLRVMLTGDAEEVNENRIIERFGERAKTDILKVGHHGSRTSTSRQFLRVIQPKVGLIGVGSYNTYGHPTADVLKNLADFGVDRVYRTDLHGTITLTSISGSMDDLRVNTERR